MSSADGPEVRPKKSFTIRVFVYSAALLYLAGDLFLFRGPLKQRIEASRPDSPESLEHARSQGVVARVFGHSIHLSQVERAAIERQWLRGRTLDELTPEQRRIERLAALNELIDHQILRVKVQHQADELPVSEAEIDAAVERLAGHFASEDRMRAELAAEGIGSEKELRLRLGGRIQQHKYLEKLIADGIAVEESEARAWFDEHAEEFAVPERVRARHVFQATLEREPDEAKSALVAALAALEDGGKTFEELAKELSDDPRSKAAGGDLGWMTKDRLPTDFGEPVFSMEPGKPRLLRTKLGWHLVEVTEKRSREERTFEEAQGEVIAALEGWKRREMVERTREALRKTEKIGVHVFPEMIPDD